MPVASVSGARRGGAERRPSAGWAHDSAPETPASLVATTTVLTYGIVSRRPFATSCPVVARLQPSRWNTRASGCGSEGRRHG